MNRPIKILQGYYRHDIINLLEGADNVGTELGVAEGIFSKRMIDSGKFTNIVGIDMYADYHDINQYKRALQKTGLFSNYKLLRMRFEDALDLFEDEFFDFIYIDGYAHGGQDGGKTIFDWYNKLKVGGIIAGDDFHSDWPLVCDAVNELAEQLEEEIMVTELTEKDTLYCCYPSWAIRKTKAIKLHLPSDMRYRGMISNMKAHALYLGKRFISKILPTPIVNRIKSRFNK